MIRITTLQAQLETVNVGTGANSRNGDPLRDAFIKVNRAIERLNVIAPSDDEMILPSQVTIPQLPENYTPDTLLVLRNGRIYFTTKAKLNESIYPVLPAEFKKGDYYVAPNGNDTNPGTYEQPFKSLQVGVNALSAGDTLVVRGGLYMTNYATGVADLEAMTSINNMDGSVSDTFKIMAYPGEVPMFDCRAMNGNSASKVGILLLNSSYWKITGIQVTRVDQITSSYGGTGFFVYNSDHITLDNCAAYINGGPGFECRNGVDGLRITNCDAYSNYNALSSTPGDNSDGFDLGYVNATSLIVVEGCRSWNNGDDGFDTYQKPGKSGNYYFRHCWAWHNGYRPDGVTTAGDGCGFKLGADPLGTYTTTLRHLTNCLAYNNRTRGFSQESGNVRKVIYNCTSYANKAWGFSFYHMETPDTVRNNIAYANIDGACEDEHYGLDTRVLDHNTWNPGTGVTISTADFTSIDASYLTMPRASDGSLPSAIFCSLAAGSDMIDNGGDAGLPYNGADPDLGYVESDY